MTHESLYKIIKIINRDTLHQYVFDFHAFIGFTYKPTKNDFIYEIEIFFKGYALHGFMHIGHICYLEDFISGDELYQNFETEERYVFPIFSGEETYRSQEAAEGQKAQFKDRDCPATLN